ncbi:MAG: hypothetical protein IH962_05665 [Chloroflexi bacterium]|nr:hypothetical protein [Chloroflexota bacterium]
MLIELADCNNELLDNIHYIREAMLGAADQAGALSEAAEESVRVAATKPVELEIEAIPLQQAAAAPSDAMEIQLESAPAAAGVPSPVPVAAAEAAVDMASPPPQAAKSLTRDRVLPTQPPPTPSATVSPAVRRAPAVEPAPEQPTGAAPAAVSAINLQAGAEQVPVKDEAFAAHTSTTPIVWRLLEGLAAAAGLALLAGFFLKHRAARGSRQH